MSEPQYIDECIGQTIKTVPPLPERGPAGDRGLFRFWKQLHEHAFHATSHSLGCHNSFYQSACDCGAIRHTSIERKVKGKYANHGCLRCTDLLFGDEPVVRTEIYEVGPDGCKDWWRPTDGIEPDFVEVKPCT